jgi:hypothetical protein
VLAAAHSYGWAMHLGAEMGRFEDRRCMTGVRLLDGRTEQRVQMALDSAWLGRGSSEPEQLLQNPVQE